MPDLDRRVVANLLNDSTVGARGIKLVRSRDRIIYEDAARAYAVIARANRIVSAVIDDRGWLTAPVEGKSVLWFYREMPENSKTKPDSKTLDMIRALVSEDTRVFEDLGEMTTFLNQ